jgi:hypothetical protein
MSIYMKSIVLVALMFKHRFCISTLKTLRFTVSNSGIRETEIKWTHQLLVYADDANSLADNIGIIK